MEKGTLSISKSLCIALFLIVFSNFYYQSANAQELKANAGQDVAICKGDNVGIGGDVYRPTAEGGTTFYSYVWSNLDGTLNNVGIANPTATPSVTTTYTLTVYDGINIETDQVVVYVSVPSGTILNLSSIYCTNASNSTLSGIPLGGTFSGSGMTGNVFDPFISDTGKIYVSYQYTEVYNPLITLFEDDFSKDRGWKGYEVGALDSGGWQRAALSGLGSLCTGASEPLVDYTSTNADNMILGTFLGACYPTTMAQTYWITSPVVNCKNMENVYIQYAHSASFENVTDFSIEFRDSNLVWHKVYKTTSTSINQAGWTVIPIVDAFDYATNNPYFQVRFGIGPTLGSVSHKGWIVDDFKVVGNYSTNCATFVTDSTFVVALPVPNAGTDQTICTGTSATLIATNFPTSNSYTKYSWSTTPVTINDTVITPALASNNVYTVTVTDSIAACSATDNVSITINPQPIAPTSANTDVNNFCSTAGGNLKLYAQGGLGDTLKWYTGSCGGTYVGYVKNPGDTLTIIKPIVTTTYYAAWSVDKCALSACASVVVTVDPTPVAPTNVTVDKNNICPEDAGNITLTYSGGTGESFVWYEDGCGTTNIGSGNNLSIASPTTTTTYYGRWEACGFNSSCAQVVLTVLSPTTTISSNKPSYCLGDNVLLSTTNGVTYNWTASNGTITPDATNATPSGKPLFDVTYTVDIVDANGCTASDDIIISVDTNTKVNAGADFDLCLGYTKTITISGGVGYLYSWSPSAGITNYGGGQSINTIYDFSPAALTTYKVTATAPTGCIDIDTLVVTVVLPPVITMGANKTICKNNSTTISVTAPVGSTYSWAPSASLSDGTAATTNASPLATTTYKVTVTDAFGCTSSGSLIVVVNNLPAPNITANPAFVCNGSATQLNSGIVGATKYIWGPWNGTLNDSSIAMPMAKPNINTIYTVTVTDAFGCSGTNSLLIQVFNPPTVNAGVDTFICIGNSVTLNATHTGATSYTWSPTAGIQSGTYTLTPTVTPADTTDYVIVVKDLNGCTATDTVNVQVRLFPIADAGPNQTVCHNDNVLLVATGGNTYLWSTTATTDSTIVNPINLGILPSKDTLYKVTVTLNGCSKMDSVKLTVKPLPVTNAGIDTNVCYAENVTLIGTGGTSFLWSNGNTNNTIVVSPTNTITYILTSTLNGCTASDDVIVVVKPLYAVEAGFDEYICNKDSITLLATNPTGHIATYSWSITGATTDFNIVAPNVTTTYQVTGFMDNGCSNFDEVVVHVNSLPLLSIAGLDTAYCANDLDVALVGIPGGGVFSGPGMTGNVFSPSSLGAGTYEIKYTYTDTFSNVHKIFEDNFSYDKGWTGYGQGGWDRLPSTLIDSCDGVYQNPLNDTSITKDNMIIGTFIGSCYQNNMTPPAKAFLSPNIDCRGYDNIYMKFASNSSFEGSNYDTAFIQVFDGIGGVQTIYSNMGGNINDTGWTNRYFNLSAIIQNKQFVRVQFLISSTDSSGTYKGWRIDDFEIFGSFDSYCTDSIIDTVVVNPLPIADAGADQTICYGVTTNIASVNVAENYTWHYDATDTLVMGFSTTPLITTTYYLTVSDLGCSSSDEIVVTVNNLPIANAGKDTAICFGQTVQLDADGGFTYTWNTQATLSDSTIKNPIANPTITTTYIVTATNTITGCFKPDTIVVTVFPKPFVDIMKDTAICFGSSFIINVKDSARGDIFVWTPIDSLSNASIINPIARPALTTKYFLNLTDTNGCSAIDSINVTVNPLPIVDAMQDMTICLNDQIDLKATPSSPANKYIWLPDGQTTEVITVSPISSKKYHVTVTDVNGCSGNDSLNVTVNSLPVSNAGLDVTICRNDSAKLNEISGTIGANYFWTPSVSLDNNIIQAPTAFPDSTTTYIVTITDMNGCKDFDSVVVTVNQLPAVSIMPNNNIICQKDSVTLNAFGGVTYKWNFTANTTSQVKDAPMLTTTYYVTATDVNTCKNTASTVVLVNTLPTVTLSVNDIICYGDSLLINASGGVSYDWSKSYVWANAIKDSIYAKPTTTSYYVVTVTNANNCSAKDSIMVVVNPLPIVNIAAGNNTLCFGDTTYLKVNGALSYIWDNTLPANDSVIINPLVTTTYNVTATDLNACVNTANIVITVNPLPLTIANINKDTVCKGDMINLNVQTPSATSTYLWSDGLGSLTSVNTVANVSHSYILKETDVNTCVNYDTVSVFVNDLPTITIASVKDTICLNDSLLLVAQGGVSYVWDNGLPAKDSVYAKPIVNTIYTVIGTDSNGCQNNASKFIVVNTLPIVVVSPASQTVCIGTQARIIASGGIIYNWDNGLPANDTVFVTPNVIGTYSVNVTDINGCQETSSAIIDVFALPVADAGFDKTICFGDSTQIITNPAYTALWNNGLTISNNDSTNTTIWAKPIATTTYILKVTNANSCTDKDTVIVYVNPLPIVNTNGNQTICIYDTATLVATGGTSYLWAPNTDINDNTKDTVKVYPTTNTTYNVTVTDNNSCSNTNMITVTVNSLPIITISKDTFICAGDSIAIMASTPGFANYTWSPVAGLNYTNIDSLNASPVDTTIYTVTVTDANNCVNTAAVTINVNPIPVVNAGTDFTICNGDQITLKVANTYDTYSWSNNVYTSDNIISPIISTTYEVTISKDGCTNSDDVVVKVNNLPALTINIDDDTICVGQTSNIEVLTAGGSTFNWSTSESVAKITVNPITTTTYYVTVLNAEGCSILDSAVIYVNNLPIVSAGADLAICIGDSITINVGGAKTYNWLPTESLDNNLIASPMAKPTINTTYTVTGTDDNGCTATDEVIVTVNAYPIMTLTNDTGMCRGDSIVLTATGGDSYFWSNGKTTPSITVKDNFSIIYAVTVSLNNCKVSDNVLVSVFDLPTANAGKDTSLCYGQNIQLLPDGAGIGGSYTWSTSYGLTDSTTQYPFASPSVTVTYTLTTTNQYGCSDTDEIVVTVNPLPVADLGADYSICKGSDAVLVVTGGTSFLWEDASTNDTLVIVSPLATNTYKVTVKDNNTCSDTDEIIVYVNDIPVANAGGDRTICLGTTIDLEAIGGTTYFWSSGQNTAKITVTPDTSIIYEVIVYKDGCSASDDVVVMVIDPSVNSMVSPDVAICIGDSTTLLAAGGDNYLWSDGSTNSYLTVKPLVTTTYNVTISLFGCSVVKAVTVTVNPLPLAFAGNDITVCKNSTVNLDADGGVSYKWSNSVNTEVNPITASIDETYYVTVTDVNGCVAVDDINITVNELPDLYVGADDAICIGDSIQLIAQSLHNIVTYQWDVANLGLTDYTVANPYAKPVINTQYLLSVTDDNGCTATDDIQIIVNNLPIINTSGDKTICFNDSVMISGFNANAVNYVWTPQAGLSADNIENPMASPAVSTTYKIAITDIKGCVNIDSLVVNVNALPVVNAGNDTAFCLWQKVQLNATGGLTYQWSPSYGLDRIDTATPMAYGLITTTYTVTATDANSCSSTDDIVVKVNELPIVNAGNDVRICNGDVFNIPTVTSANTFLWTPNDSIDFTDIQNPNVNPSKTTTYNVSVTDVNGCTATDDIIVFLPWAQAGIDKTICYGESVTLKAFGGESYIWNNGQTTSEIVVSPDTVTPFSTYIVMTLDSVGCSAFDTIDIYVNPVPYTDADADQTICYGKSVTLTANGGDTYHWSTNDDVQTIIVAPAITTTYYATATNFFGCSTMDSVIITVNPLPIANAGADITLCYGVTDTLIATGGIVYNWDNATMLDTNIITASVTKDFIVTVTDTNSCSQTDTVNVFVNPLPIINIGNDTSVCFGTDIQLLNKNANATDTYLWSPSASINDTIFDTPVDTTIYSVIITDVNGCIDSAFVTYNIIPLPIATLTSDDAICLNDSIKLIAQGGASYLWDNATTNDTLTVKPLVMTKYFVTVYDQYGCNVIDSVEITVNPLPTAYSGIDTTICFGDNVIRTATAGTAYVWSTGDLTDAINIAPTYDSTFIVTVFNTFGCYAIDSFSVYVNSLPVVNILANSDTVCSGSYFELIAQGGITYLWNTTQVEDTITVIPTATIDSIINYTVTVTDINLCQNNKTIALKIMPSPIANAGADVTTCSNSLPVILDATASTNYTGGSIKWSTGNYDTKALVFPSVTTSYTITIISLNGCFDIDTVNVKVNQFVEPVIFATNGKTGFCDNDLILNPVNTTLKLITDPSYATIIWSPNLETTDSINITTVGNYYVEVVDTNGCTGVSATTEVKIHVTEKPELMADDPDRTICEDDTMLLFLKGDIYGTKFYKYKWNSGSSTPSIKVTEADKFYAVTVTDYAGCIIPVDGFSIYIDPKPIASFSFTDSAHFVKFINQSKYAESYSWEFGDGETSNEYSPVYDYEYDGLFVVKLTATNNCGTTQDTMLIEVMEYNSIAENGEVIISNLHIYPIPANQFINVEFSFSDATPKAITINDISGRIVYSQDLNQTIKEQKHQINVSQFNNGVYFINIKTDKGDINKRVIFGR
ncbi:MAG: hypothetical protein A2X02_00585 [Bacteroidetes bacterium GWF2_29_10]|nr:MAG: hypothetical protein A2X02_00585 [Bacteroidetes bacterium GWF2_29_10]